MCDNQFSFNFPLTPYSEGEGVGKGDTILAVTLHWYC